VKNQVCNSDNSPVDPLLKLWSTEWFRRKNDKGMDMLESLDVEYLPL